MRPSLMGRLRTSTIATGGGDVAAHSARTRCYSVTRRSRCTSERRAIAQRALCNSGARPVIAFVLAWPRDCNRSRHANTTLPAPRSFAGCAVAPPKRVDLPEPPRAIRTPELHTRRQDPPEPPFLLHDGSTHVNYLQHSVHGLVHRPVAGVPVRWKHALVHGSLESPIRTITGTTFVDRRWPRYRRRYGPARSHHVHALPPDRSRQTSWSRDRGRPHDERRSLPGLCRSRRHSPSPTATHFANRGIESGDAGMDLFQSGRLRQGPHSAGSRLDSERRALVSSTGRSLVDGGPTSLDVASSGWGWDGWLGSRRTRRQLHEQSAATRGKATRTRRTLTQTSDCRDARRERRV